MRICFDGVADAGDDFAAPERLFDEVQRAVLDGIDRHRDVAAARHDENRDRIVLGVELLQNVEPRFAGNMDVQDDANRAALLDGGQQRGAFTKANHVVTGTGKDERQGLAHGRIIIDDKNLISTVRLRHSPFQIKRVSGGRRGCVYVYAYGNLQLQLSTEAQSTRDCATQQASNPHLSRSPLTGNYYNI